MKNVGVWIVAGIVASVGAMTAIHWKGIQESDRKVVQLQPLYERQVVISQMNLGMEKYRRTSSIFRKMTSEEIASAKENFRAQISKGVEQLNGLSSTEEDKALATQIQDQLANLLRLGAQYEPLLFLKDSYQKPEVQEVHDAMLGNLTKLNKSARARIDSLSGIASSSTPKSMRLMVIVSVLIVGLAIGILVRNFFIYMKPLRAIHQYAMDLRAGKLAATKPVSLTSEYDEVSSALGELSVMVETQRKERHKFIQDIVSDLRAPLAMLQAGKYLINPAGEQLSEAHQLQAAGAVRLGLSLLSGSLDDLNDVVDLNRLDSRLEERIVDLPELITDVSRVLSGSGLIKQFTTSVPPMPIWTKVDSRRFERVLIQVISKMAATLPASRKLHVSIAVPGTGNYGGVEINFQDGEKLELAKSRVVNTGPEQDVLRHWVSENGVGMTLAHKIIKAHGGTLTASGVAGTSVQFTIRLPQQRVASGLIAPPDAAMGVKTVLPAPEAGQAGKSSTSEFRA